MGNITWFKKLDGKISLSTNKKKARKKEIVRPRRTQGGPRRSEEAPGGPPGRQVPRRSWAPAETFHSQQLKPKKKPEVCGPTLVCSSDGNAVTDSSRLSITPPITGTEFCPNKVVLLRCAAGGRNRRGWTKADEH